MLTLTTSPGLRNPISKKRLEILYAASARKMPVLKRGVDVAIVSSLEIKRLNNKYRGKNKPTDVLSFSYVHHDEKPGSPPAFSLAGQMYISPEIVYAQAQRFDVPVKVEFVRMFVHGLLHCAGLDHQSARDARKMFSLQESIVRDSSSKLNLGAVHIPQRLSDDYFKASFVFPVS
jgi:probable rRNA maturation factor